jgi:hypothetical protein
MTWEELVAIEPRLAELRADAAASRRAGQCSNNVWYAKFRPRLVRLAGFGAEKPELRNSNYYDTAYDAVYAALSPPRRKAPCR